MSHIPRERQVSRLDRYAPVAFVYETIEACYGLGAIGRAKAACRDYFRAGERVLLVGVGAGGELASLLETGVSVSAVDRSPAMLRRAQRRMRTFLRNRPQIQEPQWIQADFLDWRAERPFDHVVVHFFLNLFEAPALTAVFKRLGDVLKTGGHLHLADFACPRPGFGGLLQKGYWYVPLLAAFVITGEPIHRPYNYEAWLAGAGLRRRQMRFFAPLPGIPVGFQAITAVKV